MKTIPITDVTTTKSTCCYCGVGCGLVIESVGNKVINVYGDKDHPANRGNLCTKGSTLHLTASSAGRALHPEIRMNRSEARHQVSWNEAMDLATSRFADYIKQYGPESVGIYVSGQLLTEDYYVFNKLTKALIGSNNIDSNSRLCMSSAGTGTKLVFGVDAPVANYDDVFHADTLLLAGINSAYSSPILFRRIEAAKQQNPDLFIIAVDPRQTDTTDLADMHLAIVPGTDTFLYSAMLNVLVEENLIDQAYIDAHTEGFQAALAEIKDCTASHASQVCGIPEAQIRDAARRIGQAKAYMSIWALGLNQSAHGTDNNVAILRLSIATGQVGRKPGSGPLPLTGQPNAMGGREVGAMATLMSAHRDLASEKDRAEVAAYWGIPSVPAQPGRHVVEQFEALRTGKQKAIWIICTNPSHSLSDQALVHEALSRAEFVIVQDAFHDTDTAAYADVLLPAATWAEKEGMVTNAERRISHVRKAVEPQGEARADWRIAQDFALRIAPKLGKPELTQLFTWENSEAVWNEHRDSTAGRDLDITGLSVAYIDEHGPQLWPFPKGATQGKPRLYEDGQFPSYTGKASFSTIRFVEQADEITEAFPYSMITGRIRDQWHGMTRSGRVSKLHNHKNAIYLEMNPDDMMAHNIVGNGFVEVSSRRGSIIVPVEAQPRLLPGRVFMPMHFGRTNTNHAGANALTVQAYDPRSKQPELKLAAVSVKPVSLPYDYWWSIVIEGDTAHERSERAHALVVQLREFLNGFDFAAIGQNEEKATVVTFYGAAKQEVDAELLKRLNQLFIDGSPSLEYQDAARNIYKAAMVNTDYQVVSIVLNKGALSREWVNQFMTGQISIADITKLIMMPSQTQPDGVKTKGRIVCNCLGVSETDIIEAVQSGTDTLDGLKAKLECGTKCGSCVPEIKRLIQFHKKPD